MRLTQIRDFVAVIEAGSIRAAARQLGVSQPAMSKSVRSLEDELHAQLLQRTSNGVAPTRAGRAFFARASIAQTELRKAEEEATQKEGDGTVAFGVGPLAAILIVPEAISRFHRRFGNAQIRVIEGLAPALLPLVRNETLDFALGLYGGRIDVAIGFRPLYRPVHVIVARKDHPLRDARTLAELASADWLNLAVMGDQRRGPFEEMFAAAQLPAPRQIVRCESYNTMIATAARTDMLGILPRSLLARAFVRDALDEIKIPGATFQATVGVYTRAGAPLTRVAGAMARTVVAVSREVMRSR